MTRRLCLHPQGRQDLKRVSRKVRKGQDLGRGADQYTRYDGAPQAQRLALPGLSRQPLKGKFYKRTLRLPNGIRYLSKLYNDTKLYNDNWMVDNGWLACRFEAWASGNMINLSALLQHTAQQTYPTSCLYVVATPIGNMADISCRALHVLSIVDAIACEDTRNTAQLLTYLDIAKPLIAAHQHNENEIAQKIISRLQQGERIALVSDAGTPAVSDPGARIVNAVHEAGFQICPVPGASAVVTALSASGLVHDQFYFVGFLPSKSGQRDNVLHTLKDISATLVFYEAPHRIVDTVAALTEIFSANRKIVFARELTKLFEELHRCDVGLASQWLASNIHRQKGEYVVLLEGASTEQDVKLMETKRVLKILLQSCSVKQAAQLAAHITGQKKNTVYQLALDLHDNDDSVS